MAVRVPDRCAPGGRMNPPPPPVFLNVPVVSSYSSYFEEYAVLITLAGMYASLVCGLNVIGAHALPPELPGKIRTGLSQNGVKRQPCSNAPSGSGHSGTKRSPMGNGCVAADLMRAS